MKFLITILLVLCAITICEMKFVLSEHDKTEKEEMNDKKVARIHRKNRCHHCICGQKSSDSDSAEALTTTSSTSTTTSTEEICNPTPGGTSCANDTDCISCLSGSFMRKNSCEFFSKNCGCSVGRLRCDEAHSYFCCDGSTCQNGYCPPAITGGLCYTYGNSVGYGNCASGNCKFDTRAVAAMGINGGGRPEYGICQ